MSPNLSPPEMEAPLLIAFVSISEVIAQKRLAIIIWQRAWPIWSRGFEIAYHEIPGVSFRNDPTSLPTNRIILFNIKSLSL